MITDKQIREVFLAHGFTIKPGYDDLRPYVYEAAKALLALAAPAPQAEPVGHVYTMEALDSWGFDGSGPRCHVRLYQDLPAGTPLFTAPSVKAQDNPMAARIAASCESSPVGPQYTVTVHFASLRDAQAAHAWLVAAPKEQA